MRFALLALLACMAIGLVGPAPATAESLGDDTRRTVVAELQKILRDFDENDDGRLDAAEQRALATHAGERHGQRWVAPLLAVLAEADADGDASVADSEWTRYAASVLERRPPGSSAGAKTVMVPMSDGLSLATDVYLPEGDGPWPVILMRTPYDRTKTGGRNPRAAVVAQDVRGRFASEGWNFPFVGCGWAFPQDGKDTIDWIRAQPWCDGRVFTTGGSALGITQNLTAGARPEGVVAQYIVVAAASLYHHAAYQGGAFRLSQVEGWCTGNHFDPKAVDTLRAHAAYDRLWSRYDAMAKASDIELPAMHVGGWFDTFALGTIDAYRTRQRHGGPGARGKQKLVMGPWVHGIGKPVHVGKHSFPDYQVPAGYRFDDWRRYWLGEADGEAPNVAYYVMGDVADASAPGNEWRYADDWPVPCRPAPMYFRADGGLSWENPVADGSEGSVELTFDPENPCPTRGGCNLCIEAGPLRQNDVEARDDVLTFTSAPLEEPLEVTGHPKLEIFLSSSAVDTDLSVRLCDVYPDGSSYLMAEGMLRVRFRNSLAAPEPMEPGETYRIEFETWPTSIVFNRGHRLRVDVTSSNHPRFDLNPGTGEPWHARTSVVKQINRIHTQGAQASRIVLPLAGQSALE